MAMLRAPGAPVTSASPIVTITASSLPAANASIDGAYSNQSNFTSSPASLNHPFSIPTSNAVHPGQSLKAMRSGGLAGGAAGAAGAATGAADGGGTSLLQPASAKKDSQPTRTRFMPATIRRRKLPEDVVTARTP